METILHLLPLTSAQQDAFRAAAPEEEHLFLPTNDRRGAVDIPPEWRERTTILMGFVPPEDLKTFPHLRWVQSWNAGVDPYLVPGVLREGSSGTEVEVLQYMLAILAEFDNALSPLAVDGVFGPNTARAVRAYQRAAGLGVDGVVGPATWDSIYRHFIQADQYLRRNLRQFPRTATQAVPASVNEVGSAGSGYENTPRLGQYPGYEIKLGQTDGRKAVLV